MPTYVFRCTNGHEFKRVQSIDDKPRSRCPTCRKKCQRMLPYDLGGWLEIIDAEPKPEKAK